MAVFLWKIMATKNDLGVFRQALTISGLSADEKKESVVRS
jgi:hypothetical protein